MLCDYYLFSMVRTFTICSLSNFQVYDMVINKDFLILAARAGIVQGPLEITGLNKCLVLILFLEVLIEQINECPLRDKCSMTVLPFDV